MPGFTETFLNLAIMQAALPYLLQGLGTTLLLVALVVPLGIAGGLAVALLYRSPRRRVRWPLILYVDFFRAFPPLVLLIFLYAGLPFAGIEISAFAAVAIGFLLNNSAYYGEVLRAGIESVPRGQMEAARSTGLSRYGTLLNVVLPQAVRLTIPPLTNRVIALTKGTALGSVIAVHEIIYYASSGASLAGNPTPLTLGALAYLLLFLPVVVFSRWIETRFAWKR